MIYDYDASDSSESVVRLKENHTMCLQRSRIFVFVGVFTYLSCNHYTHLLKETFNPWIVSFFQIESSGQVEPERPRMKFEIRTKS